MLILYRKSPLARWWGGGHTVQVSTLFKLNPPLVHLGLLQMHRMELMLVTDLLEGRERGTSGPFYPLPPLRQAGGIYPPNSYHVATGFVPPISIPGNFSCGCLQPLVMHGYCLM